MRTLRALFLLLPLLIAAGASPDAASRKESADPAAEARAVLALLGHLEIDTMGDELFAMMVSQIVPMMRRKVPDLPEDAYATLHEEMAATLRAGRPDLLGANVRLYAEHLTPEEVAEMNAFYATKTGRKMLKVLPALMQQSYYMGQEWVETLQRQAEQVWLDRLKREGYLK